MIQRISLAADVFYKIRKSDFGIHTEALDHEVMLAHVGKTGFIQLLTGGVVSSVMTIE